MYYVKLIGGVSSNIIYKIPNNYIDVQSKYCCKSIKFKLFFRYVDKSERNFFVN